MLDAKPTPQELRVITVLPSDGEALITPKTFAAALEVSESTLWAWLKSDASFPKPVRRGERFTRFRLSQVRAYIAGMTAGTPKAGPAVRKKVPA